MKYTKKLQKELSNIRRDMKNIHPYSKDVLKGSVQFSILLLLFAVVMSYLAPYTANIGTTIDYYRAALDVAPTVMATGFLSAFLCELVLRQYKGVDTKQAKPKSKDADDGQDKDIEKK